MCFPLAVPSSVRERRKRPLFCYVINFVENEIVLFLQSGFEFLVGFLSFLRFQLWCVDFIMMFSLCARKRIKKQNSSCNEKTKKGWKIFCAHSFTIFISTFFVCFSLHESLIFVDLFSTPRPAIASLKLKHLSAVWETTHTHIENTNTNAQNNGKWSLKILDSCVSMKTQQKVIESRIKWFKI